MKKKESDSYSVHSSRSAVSRSSERRRPTSGRFSLRRIFCRSSTSPRLYQTTRTSSDVESDISTGSGSQNESSQTVVVARVPVVPDPSSSSAGSGVGSGGVECPLCLTRLPDDSFPHVMTCDHRSCRDCFKQYLRIEITESRVNITCPECAERLHPNDIAAILNDGALMLKYEEFMIRRILVADPDVRWCPAPDCGYAVIAAGCASCPRIGCERPGCNTFFCYHCKQHWHPNQTCDAARAERSGRSSSFSYSHESGSQNDIKPCPRCGAFIVKMDDGSCNHMTCAVCGAEFCWLCMKEISDLHYLSPSGCTFWGKKPWSRKKKILWQLGTLVGAPVGIGLMAGIAVPAMIIGIPVWVGRKLHTKYEHAPKHRRNAVIVGGVTASVLVSPIIAGLAVGIGVPILLAYVYGVVPISLCRSGGCGVTTTNSGGVRFDFDDDNEVTVGVSGPYADAHSVDATSNQGHMTNPSIGPSIGELSMGLTGSLSASGSHMDRVGIIRDESDRESSSHRAIAGASLNGSLSGSTTAAFNAYQNKLEVQVDVANGQMGHKRASLSSESANFSIGEKSTTVSFGGDDVSTKALAGSIAGNRAGDNNSTIMEIQVDVPNGCAKFYSGEPGSEVTEAAKPSGSPTSSRSVNFAGEETLRPNRNSRKYKRRSVSVGDKIHEHAGKHVEDYSVKSLTADHEPTVSCLKKTNLQVTHDYRSASPSYSTSMDNVVSSEDSNICGITEVENDRPVTSLSAPPPLVRNQSVCSDTTVDIGATTLTLTATRPKYHPLQP